MIPYAADLKAARPLSAGWQFPGKASIPSKSLQENGEKIN
jgi:hypothetical protein